MTAPPPDQPKPDLPPSSYLHPRCYECQTPKGPKTSHCDSQFCPWCDSCGRTLKTRRNLPRK